MKLGLKKMFGMIVVCAMFATAIGMTAAETHRGTNDQVISLGDPRDPYGETAAVTTTGDPRDPYCVQVAESTGDPKEPYMVTLV